MARQGDYQWYTSQYQDVSGSDSEVGAVNQTLATPRKAGYALFLQRANVHITSGAAGVTWKLKDSNGAELTGPFDAATSGTAHTRDFGPAGVQLSDNARLELVVSGAGATGAIAWEAYQKQVATLAVSAT